MAHFGVLSPKGTGHLTPLIALSQVLIARGHRVTFFLQEEAEGIVRAHDLDFCAIPVSKWLPPKPGSAKMNPRSTGDWIRDTKRRLRAIDLELLAYLNAYLEVIPDRAIDALIMGEITLTGPTVAEILQLPYFVISTSLPHNFGWDAPRHLRPSCVWQERLQKRVLEVSIFNMRGPIRRQLKRHRKQRLLGSGGYSELAHITQWPHILDGHRVKLPERFYYTGPFAYGAAQLPRAFPWERLDGRLLVYASLGTTKRGEVPLFRRIAEACALLDVQLAIALGGRSDAASVIDLPGDPIVVEQAPQVELLKRADLVITHAGPNTVLESLLQGKPMLAMPLGLDQPAIASRLEKLHCAVVLGGEQRSAVDICKGLEMLRMDSSYREAAEDIRQKLREVSGASRAAEIIETSLEEHYKTYRGRGKG